MYRIYLFSWVLSYLYDAWNVFEASTEGSVGFADGQKEWGILGGKTFRNQRISKVCNGVIESDTAEVKMWVLCSCRLLCLYVGAKQ